MEDFICIQKTFAWKLNYIFDLHGKRQHVTGLDCLLFKTKLNILSMPTITFCTIFP
jgi:hypothetical protein